VSGYIWFSSFSSSLLLWFYRVTPYTLGSYTNWIVWLLAFPFYFYIFIVYTTSIHSLGALQHCSTWISREFLWNSTYIGTCCLQYRHISGYLSPGNITHITGLVKQGLQVSMMLIIAWCDCNCMLCIVINMWLLKIHGVYKLYTHVFPSLSKYGVYNISPLIVLAHTVNCVLCTSIFISLCGFVPWLGVWTHY